MAKNGAPCNPVGHPGAARGHHDQKRQGDAREHRVAERIAEERAAPQEHEAADDACGHAEQARARNDQAGTTGL